MNAEGLRHLHAPADELESEPLLREAFLIGEPSGSALRVTTNEEVSGTIMKAMAAVGFAHMGVSRQCTYQQVSKEL